MIWKINYLSSVKKDIKSFDIKTRKQIKEYLETNIASLPNPRIIGKSLRGKHTGFWRYRIGNYRVICEIQDKAILILVVKIGHRKEVYK